MTERDPRNDERDQRVLDAAVQHALDQGYASLTRLAVAERAGVAESTVSNYRHFRITKGDDLRPAPVMDLLREDVMRWAVEHGAVTIVRDGLAARHPVALAAPDQLRVAALTA